MQTEFEKEAIRLQLEQSTSDINRCFDALVGKQDRRNIPEELFVQEFLPYFSGQKQLDQGSNVLSNWVTIAGTPFAEVNVTDNAGNTVVVVPGLMNTLQHNLTERSKTTFHDIVVQAEIVGSQQSILGTRYLNNKLDEKQKELINEVMPEAVTPVKDQWSNIFQHYGIIKAEVNKQNNPEQPPLDENVEYV